MQGVVQKIRRSREAHGRGALLRWASHRLQRTRPGDSYLRKPPWLHRLGQLVRESPKNLLFYFLRVAPYPVRPGLLVIGNPGRRAPVLITTNYDLTVRHVTRSLAGIDCYLLVAPAGGINVWCASGGGHFSIDAIVSIIKTSRIEELVAHRRLILPQLCASGINALELERRTGWTPVFGPVRAEDVPEYLRRRGRKTGPMRRVTFTRAQRLEMALAMWGSLTLRYTLFPLLILGWNWALGFVALLGVFSAIVAAGCFILPGKTFVQKAGVVALLPWLGGLGSLAATGALSAVIAIKWTVLALGAAFLVGSAFPGYSPLWQCNYSRLFFGSPRWRLELIEYDCTGCRMCDDICPVACFSPTSHGTYALVNPQLCEGCGACVLNCRTNAIVNHATGRKALATACGC